MSGPAPRDLRASYEVPAGSGVASPVVARLAAGRLEVKVGDASATFEATRAAGETVLLRDPTSGRVVRAIVVAGPGEGETSVAIGGRLLRIARATDQRKARAHAAHDSALEAPMPGTCREVFVKPGDRVEKGARLVLIEAMKMEHELKAPRAGVVKSVAAKKGEPVSPGTPLVTLEPAQ